MKEKLTNNLSLKIIAVLFAAGLWMISININDPYQSKDYSVVVQLQNINAMTREGKYVEVVNDSDEITVRVRGSRSVMENFSVANISATADLNDIDADNRVPIKLSTIKTSGSKIESIRSANEHLTVRVEDIRKIQKKIEVATKNTPETGYILGRTSTEQNALSISGPESVVNTVAKAVVTFDLSGATDDVSMLLPIELYDADGKRIYDSRLTTSISEVQCVASILAVKEVPIVFETKGTAAAGYGFTGEIKVTPDSVLIAAKNSVLRSINEILIADAIDIQNATEDVSVSVDLRKYLPENVILGAASFDGQVTAAAKVEKEVELQAELGWIEIVNLPEGYKAEAAETKEPVYITVTGYESMMSQFHERDIKVRADIEKYMNDEGIDTLEPGTYRIELVFELPEGIWIEDEIQAEIEISER